MANKTKKAVMTIANTLVYKFNIGRREALKQSWQMVKRGFSCNLSGVTFGNRQATLKEIKEAQIKGAHIQRERNRYNRNSLIVVTNGIKLGYLKDKTTAIVNALIEKGINVITRVLNVVGGNGFNYGLTVGLRLVA